MNVSRISPLLSAFGLVLSGLVFFVDIVPGQEVLVRSKPKSHSLRSSVTADLDDASLSMLVLNLPLPSTNPYQDVKSVDGSCSPNGRSRTLNYPETQENFLSAVFRNPKEKATLTAKFEVVLYEIAVDFSRIDKIYPYKKSSALYKTHTGRSGTLVVPDHPDIDAAARRLWEQSSGNLLDYAKNAYIYVAENYRYLNPYTGIHPLEKILRDGGGDCGNLSSIYVSLLRNRGIPARHLVGVRPDGTFHVWADFYLEKYGWIPVDVTYKNSNPRGDFFGRVSATDVPVILSTGVHLTVNGVDQNRPAPKTVELMQNYSYWYWHLGASGKPVCRFQFENLRPGDAKTSSNR